MEVVEYFTSISLIAIGGKCTSEINIWTTHTHRNMPNCSYSKLAVAEFTIDPLLHKKSRDQPGWQWEDRIRWCGEESYFIFSWFIFRKEHGYSFTRVINCNRVDDITSCHLIITEIHSDRCMLPSSYLNNKEAVHGYSNRKLHYIRIRWCHTHKACCSNIIWCVFPPPLQWNMKPKCSRIIHLYFIYLSLKVGMGKPGAQDKDVNVKIPKWRICWDLFRITPKMTPNFDRQWSSFTSAGVARCKQLLIAPRLSTNVWC